MKVRNVLLGFILCGTGACASSVELENQSRVHTLRADSAAQARDYRVAAREKEEAEDLHAKAMKKAYKEGRTDVIVPADVAAPPTP
jgi:hypothetical protein